MEKPGTCWMCPNLLVQPVTGRPAVYCSPACRRAAEYELRRVQSMLLRAEKKAMDARAAHADELFDKPRTRRAVKFWAGEVAVLQARLRDLLGASSGGPVLA